MKHFKILIVTLFISAIAIGQEKLILKKELTDLTKSPHYPNWVTQQNGKDEFKEPLKFLENINLYTITYLSDGLKIEGLLIEPKKQGKYPCIIFNRGGSLDFGKLSLKDGFNLGRIAEKGYVIIASQYRGNSKSEGKEEFGGQDVNDVTILPKVLEEVAKADTKNIGMYGWSRGGMMTYIASSKMKNLKAIIVGGGRSGLTKIDRPEMETGVYAKLIPNYSQNKSKELKKRSAIYWVDKFPKNTPVLLLHGNSDWRVKAENSLKLALEFEKHRIPYRLKIFDGADHSISEFRREVNYEVINWFNRYLRNGEKPNTEYHGK